MRRPVVLITGAKRGIGRGIALEFATADYDVVINDLACDADGDETLALVQGAGAKAAFVAADISDLGGHAALVEAAFAAFGGIDVLVNNAGVSVAKRGDILDVTPESFDRLVTINLRGPFFLTQAVSKRWLATDDVPHARSVITISSANAFMPSPDRSEYCIAKTGLSMMSKLYALRLAEAGIGAFEIRPGVIRTSMTAVAFDRYEKAIAEGLTPIRRWGEAQDIGKAAVALAGGAFHFSTGETIHVDGGLHIHRL